MLSTKNQLVYMMVNIALYFNEELVRGYLGKFSDYCTVLIVHEQLLGFSKHVYLEFGNLRLYKLMTD